MNAAISPVLTAAALLACSNVFITFAWYAHLRDLGGKPWIIAALVSWGIALFEYLLQVPANRIGYTVLTCRTIEDHAKSSRCRFLFRLHWLYMKEPLRSLICLWAGLCLVGAAYFIFRGETI
jgi:uncharacterized protein (DUF486 family)